MRAALWLRVSTDEQNTENQQLQMQRLAASRNYTVVKTWQLEASAWKGAQAEALHEVYQAALAHEFDALLVWAVDRLDRRGIVETLQTVRQLVSTGIILVSLQEPWIEQGGPMRELLLAIFAWIAHMESERRSERTKAGMTRAKAEGKHVGRPTGAKDKGQRRKLGYLLRYATEAEKRKYGKQGYNKQG